MTKITQGSPSHAFRGYSPRSEDTTPVADTARTPATPSPSQDTQSTQAESLVQAEYWRDSFTPAVASADAVPEPVLAAAGTLSSTSRGDEAAPIAQVGGANGNGGPLNEYTYDGALIDGQGNVYPPGTSREGLTPTRPSDGQPADETLYYVNGIQTTAEQQATSMQNIADTTGANVFGVHNATWGFLQDLAQSGLDKLSVPNPASTALAETITQDLEAGKPVHLVAHSQGGLITSTALGQVQEQLTEAHGAERAEELMSTIQVETFGGAAASYPYGPRYVHYINEDDLVPMQTGLGSIDDPAERQAAAGGDRAAIHFIRDDPRQEPGPDLHLNGPLQNNLTSHDFNDGYLSHRLPFEEALANNDDLGSRPSPVRQEDGTAVYHEEPPPSEAEANERRATQAAADSARALAQVEAAVRSRDLAAARAAAAPLEEYARVTQEAADQASEFYYANIDAATQEVGDAMEAQDPLIAPSLFPSTATTEELAQAQARVDAALEAQADLHAGVTETQRAVDQTQEHLARAAELLRQLELDSMRRGTAIAG